MAERASIFVSYRRSDAAGHAGRLFDRLKHWFDPGVVFYDLAGLESGDHFPQRLEIVLRDVNVVLVLMGPDWLAEINRRATLPHLDFVRTEVEQALSLQAANDSPRVIPVLLGGARMPASTDLHESLRPGLEKLLALDAHEFQGKDADWEYQFGRLRDLIAAVPGVPTPRYRAPARAEKPCRLAAQSLSPHFNDPGGALEALPGKLASSGMSTIVPMVLSGMGGVGKTQLALKYSLDNRDKYAGVWWFRAESEETLLFDARDACKAAGAALSEGELPTASLNRWLATQDEPWLLVFDNAENATALRPHLPKLGAHHVLITSRDPAWGGMAKQSELSVWSDDQGADFLGARLANADREDLKRLSRSLGGLQLALEQAAAFLEQSGSSVDEYCALIDGVDTSALLLDEGRASTGYENSVFATMALAFSRLSPAARDLLGICAYFAAEPIPERYFRERIDDVPEILALGAKDVLGWNRTVGDLRRYGIATRIDIPALDRVPGTEDERKEKALVLHRLTLEIARHALSDPARHGLMAVHLMQVHCPESVDEALWPRYAALFPHFMNLERFASQQRLDARVLAVMRHQMAFYLLMAHADHDTALRLYQGAVETFKTSLGEEHPATLQALTGLAMALQVHGDTGSARALQEQVLAVMRRVHGPEHAITMMLMNTLGNTMLSQGDVLAARAHLEETLALQRRVLGEEHLQTLMVLGSLGDTFAATDFQRAAEIQESVYAGFKRVLGADHPTTIMALGSLAERKRRLGDTEEACRAQAQVLAAHRRRFGTEHLFTMSAMSAYALALADRNDLDQARSLSEESVALYRKVVGAEHPDSLSTLSCLAQIVQKQGDLRKARELHEQVLESRRRVLGVDHAGTVMSMRHVAHLLSLMGERERGVEMLKEALRLLSARYGDGHPQATAVAELLAELQK